MEETNSREKQTRRNRDHAQRGKIYEERSKISSKIREFLFPENKRPGFMLFLKNEDDFKNKRALKK